MVSTPRLLSSSGEQLSKQSQQDGLVGAHDSTDWLISSWLATHANGSTEPDTDSSTIDSHETSDAEFDHDIYHPTNDEQVSETEYNDLDRTIDDEGFHELDTVSVMSLDSVVENYLFCCRRQYPNPGTGYSYDVADDNPGIHVIGIDIAPIQPASVPPNLELKESTFDESSIDYIHARGLSGNVDRTVLTRNAFKTLKPGGIVEFDEMAIDFGARERNLQEESQLCGWKEFFVTAGEKRSTPFIFVGNETLRREVESAGFEDVQVCTYEIPLGTWSRSTKAGLLGQYFLETLTKDMVGSVLRIATEDFEWSEQRAQIFAASVRKYIILNCNRQSAIIPGCAGREQARSTNSTCERIQDSFRMADEGWLGRQ
ncbi:hypothetical protein FCOIX_5555 [Fusarium coicis]|nr:hypothetical protein FCOIX_5555 [Fusarium coicis]